MNFLEVIAAIRDLVIILSAVIVTVVAVLVGRAILRLTQKAESLSAFVVSAVTSVTNPLQGILRAIGRNRPSAQRRP